MNQADSPAPNPKRVAAGRVNRMKRGILTAGGRQSLREAALRNRPWEHSTGPRTAAGKAQAVENGKTRQIGSRSVREMRSEVADVASLIRQMSESRDLIKRTLEGRGNADATHR